MYTYEMVGLADQNGKEYECEYGTYSSADGFKFNESVNSIVEDKGWREIVNILFHDNLWKLKKDPVKRMTQDELEEILGYKVQIVDPQPDKEEIDEKHRKTVDDTVRFFKDFFNLDVDPEDYY